MKKLFTTIAVAVGFCIGASAQVTYWNTDYFSSCNAATNSVSAQPSADPGLSPSDTALPCATRFTYVSDTIYFTNFTTVIGYTLTSLKIDSLYVPAGLCWSTNKANNTFAGGESGVILVQGTPTAPAGRYKLRIIADATVNGTITLPGIDAEAQTGLRYYVRVACAGDPCPPLDKTDSVSIYVPSSSTTNCGGVGVADVSNTINELSVSPNPFSGVAHVTFSSEVEGKYTLKMTNLLGAVVYSKEVSISTGQNNIEINRAGFSAGMYTLSLSNGQSGAARKVVIE